MPLKVERVKKNLTQKDLQELTGISRPTISKIEKGNTDVVTLGVYKKLAQALEIPIEELIKESEV